MKKDLRIVAVGIPWYRREDYPALLQLFVDGHVLPPSYDKWLQLASQLLEQVQKSGCIAVKAHIEPQAFALWYQARGLDIDANARKAFANWTAAREYRQLN